MFQCNNSSRYECINTLDWIVLCNEDLQVAAAIDCHCITYDSKTSTIMAGSCLAQCSIIKQNINQDNNAYYDLPRNINELNISDVDTGTDVGFFVANARRTFILKLILIILPALAKMSAKENMETGGNTS